MTRGVVLFQFFDVRFSGAPVNGVLQHQSGLAALRREELGQEKLLQNGRKWVDQSFCMEASRKAAETVTAAERQKSGGAEVLPVPPLF